MAVAGTTLTTLQIVLQRGIPAGSCSGGLHCPFRQAGTTQIGMQSDAGGIDHRTQGGLCRCLCTLTDTGAQFLCRGQLLQITGQNLPPEAVDALPHQIGDNALGQLQRCNGRLPQHFVHLGQTSEQSILIHVASLHIKY